MERGGMFAEILKLIVGGEVEKPFKNLAGNRNSEPGMLNKNPAS
jgi:hypothetical protein